MKLCTLPKKFKFILFIILFSISILANINMAYKYHYKKIIFDYITQNAHKYPFMMKLMSNTKYINKIASKKATKQQDINIFYQLMKDTDKILTKNSVPYWIDGGTLLGSIRHGGLIPWDDDLDISIKSEDDLKFQLLKPIFEKLGYDFSNNGFGYRVYSSKKIPNSKKSPPYIDIFIIDKVNTNYVYQRFFTRNWPYKFKSTDLYPLKRCKFGPLSLSCPNNPTAILNNLYGESWSKVAYKGGDHIGNNKDSNYKPFALKEQDYKPALPSIELQERIN